MSCRVFSIPGVCIFMPGISYRVFPIRYISGKRGKPLTPAADNCLPPSAPLICGASLAAWRVHARQNGKNRLAKELFDFQRSPQRMIQRFGQQGKRESDHRVPRNRPATTNRPLFVPAISCSDSGANHHFHFRNVRGAVFLLVHLSPVPDALPGSCEWTRKVPVCRSATCSGTVRLRRRHRRFLSASQWPVCV